MKIKIFFTLISICGITRAQNPTANFRCTFYSFDPTTFECCIGFEDLAFDGDGSVLSQIWDFGDPASGSANYSTGHFLFHCYSSLGTYTVTFSVIDNDGNVDTLRAINCIVVDTLGCHCNWTTNIHDFSQNISSLQIYPNPTSSVFTIKDIFSKYIAKLEIIDVFGEIVHSELLEGKNDYVIHSNFESGIYFVHVINGEGHVVRKLVIDK